ncbi:karyopherin beta [Gonapodya sp. JEL0774]|nr:karyopherin beta [Gonapodya sp. JEL0774]
MDALGSSNAHLAPAHTQGGIHANLPSGIGLEDNGAYGAFASSFLVILVSEIGDKTFLINWLIEMSVMAMRHPRLLVFSAAMSALALMSVLSACLGYALPALLSRRVTQFLAALLFVAFGIKMVKEAKEMRDDAAEVELAEVSQELQEKENEGRDEKMESGGLPSTSPMPPASFANALTALNNLAQYVLSPVFVQTFVMTFLAEWGDRSQISTIVLAAAKNPYWVTLGAILGHSLCTGGAVVGGKLVASRISVKTVTYFGAVLFIAFGVWTLDWAQVSASPRQNNMSTAFGAVLANTLQPDQRLREEATAALEKAATDNYAAFLAALSQELANEAPNLSHIRQAAGLQIKNSLQAKEDQRAEQYAQRWITLDPPTKAAVRNFAMITLGSDDKQAGNAAAQVISAMASIDLPRNDWPELVPKLLENMSTEKMALRLHSLQAIGFICETIEPELLVSQANNVLTAVVQGARKEEPSNEVRLAALQALYNSLEFIKANFARDGERNYIMQVVCEATVSDNQDVQVSAYECLVRIMQLYYDYMGFYMEKALFGLTVMGMKHQNEKVALQAVEFWSTVCEEEIEIQSDAEEAELSGDEPSRVSKDFAGVAVKELVPVLLHLLTKKEEEDDEDEWNLPMASATCLSLLANCVRDVIVQPVIPFVEQNITSQDWRYREAAVMAFGSILEGPQSKNLAPLVQQALPLLLNMMRDTQVSVKDTAAWTLGRISDVLADTLKEDAVLRNVLQAVVHGLVDSPRVASNCCWCIINLSDQLAPDEPEPQSYVMSPYFDGLISALLNITAQAHSEVNFRATAHEAMSSLVSHCAKDCYPSVERLMVAILDRLDASIAMQSQLVNQDDRNVHYETQANLCSVLTSCVRRLRNLVAPNADRIMTSLLNLMGAAARSSTVLEDAFLTIGAFTAAVEGDFIRYIDKFTPFLEMALRNHEEHQMCSIAVGIVGDICRALNDQALPYCDSFMTLLLQNLQSPQLHRDVKPAILSCFGDIALAIGGRFQVYLDVVMMVLQQACQIHAPPNNYDMIDYVNQLREGIIEAYVGIVQGLKSGDKASLLLPHTESVFRFLQAVNSEDADRGPDLTRQLIGLVGDFAESFPRGEIKPFLQEQWVENLIREGRSWRGDGSASVKEVAKWAQAVIKRQNAA